VVNHFVLARSFARRFKLQLTNFSAYTALQAASYLIPVVTIPYFARTLTITGIGEVAIAAAVALAGAVLMDYGVLLSGTRFAANHTNDPEALNEYLVKTSVLKLMLLLALGAAFVAAVALVDFVQAHFWVFFWSIISAAAMCLFPQWLFQGLLIVPVAARILVTTRVLAAVSALVLVRTPADTFVVPMTQACGGIIALLASTIFLRRRYGLKVLMVAPRRVLDLARENFPLFSATAWGAIHTHGSIIIMGALLPPRSVGFYSIAERISQAFVSIFNIAAQTGFPSLVRGHARQDPAFAQQVRSYLIIVSVISAICLGTIFAVRAPLYYFFSGERSEVGLTIFSIWLFSSFFTVLCVSTSPILVAMHLDLSLAKVYRITGLGFIIIAPLAAYYLGGIGMALAALFPQCFMAIYCLIAVDRALGKGLRFKLGPG
jgi:PST family polysaccharide transporter